MPSVTCTIAMQFSSFSPLHWPLSHAPEPLLGFPATGRACRGTYANIIYNSEWEGNSFASFFSPARGIRPASRITFKSVSKPARLQESVPQVSYLAMPSHIIFQAISASSLMWEPDHVLLLANIAVKWEIIFSCFKEIWLDWTYLAL